MNLSLPPDLLIEAANCRLERWEAGGTGQSVAVFPLVLVQLQQVVVLDPGLQFPLVLPPHHFLHLLLRRHGDRPIQHRQGKLDLRRPEPSETAPQGSSPADAAAHLAVEVGEGADDFTDADEDQ